VRPPPSIRSFDGGAPKPRTERGDRPGRERYREDRERGRRPRGDGPSERPSGERLSAGRDDRKRRERRPAAEERPPAPPPAAKEPERRPRAAAVGERDFWSVWREDEGPTMVSPPPASDEPTANAAPAPPETGSETGSDQARLFLNLGRKDDATAEEVAALFGELGVAVPPEDIEVMNTHSYINVPPGDAERLCTSLSGRERQGRRLSCEPARPRRR
jgi:DbpA RNA binding domain